MLKTEFIRNLNCNYERIQLEQKPEEKKYQYCILSRGGIRGLLPCSLRYIDGQAYLYYDISSTQNVAQLYDGRPINRRWMKDFLWSMRQMQVELGRFLLDDRNLLWFPNQIFQDLEKNDFYFLYVPYYEGDSGFSQLIEYWVEHIDYEDEALVEYVYKMYEQFELLGTIYLQEQIFEDAGIMDQMIEELTGPQEKQQISGEKQPVPQEKQSIYQGKQPAYQKNQPVYQEKQPVPQGKHSAYQEKHSAFQEKNSVPQGKHPAYQENQPVYQEKQPVPQGKHSAYQEKLSASREKHPEQKAETFATMDVRKDTEYPQLNMAGASEEKIVKKGIRSLLEGRRKKQKMERSAYQQEVKEWMNGYAVCEETVYHEADYGADCSEEDYGRTVYLEEINNEEEIIRKLYGKDGGMAEILKSPFLIGKKKDEVDFCIPDNSVSRIHARILTEENGVYLEDLNSTNGTFKNGLRMLPYEKKKLEPEDDIRFGKLIFIYR